MDKSFNLKFLIKPVKHCNGPPMDVVAKRKFITVTVSIGVVRYLAKKLVSGFSLPTERSKSMPYRKMIG